MVLKPIMKSSNIISCSPDLKTNFENMNLNFHDFFDQSEQVRQVDCFFCQNPGFVISNLVIGSCEQNIHSIKNLDVHKYRL